MNKKLIVVSWVLVVLQALLIFYFSSKPAAQSREMSKGVTEIVINTMAAITPGREANLDIGRVHFLVRKNAHFISYMILGLLSMNAVRKTGFVRFKGILITFLICLVYAISDEFHQTFIPGRSGEVRDVVIDSIGGIAGIVFYFVITQRKSWSLPSSKS